MNMCTNFSAPWLCCLWPTEHRRQNAFKNRTHSMAPDMMKILLPCTRFHFPQSRSNLNNKPVWTVHLWYRVLLLDCDLWKTQKPNVFKKKELLPWLRHDKNLSTMHLILFPTAHSHPPKMKIKYRKDPVLTTYLVELGVYYTLFSFLIVICEKTESNLPPKKDFSHNSGHVQILLPCT